MPDGGLSPVRVLIRVMKKVTAVTGQVGAKLRDRSRSVKLKVLAIARASRNKTDVGEKKMKAAYLRLMAITRRVVGDATKFAREIAAGVKKGNRKILRKAKRELEQMIPRAQQVLRQTRERVVRSNTKSVNKIFSVFEAHTELIRKGKTNKPNEFGQLALLQEGDNQIVTHSRFANNGPPTPPY